MPLYAVRYPIRDFPHEPKRKAGRHLRRLPSVLVLLFGAALFAAACGGASGAGSTSTPRAAATTVSAGAGSTLTATTDAATPTPAAPDLSVFRNFIYPIRGACLPSSDTLMPNAPRPYRNGIHEGIDFYQVDSCNAQIGKGTPVLAAKDGIVIRADWGYTDLTQAELDAVNAKIASGQANDPAVIDLLRGRQVWIDHGNGIVTRYAHLGGIADGVQVGAKVAQGQVIAYVGESGTPESITAPGTEMHLQWEVRTGDTYLGQGLPPDAVRAIYEKLFEPWP